MASSGYIFARDLRASIRLNYQHWAIKQLCGFLLHHSIPLQDIVDEKTLYIADLGTGTGLWPIELSQQLPSAHITGFDISGAQFPPTAWRPQNVELEEHNVLTPFPERHLGKYHVVHVRFFVTLLSSEDQMRAFVENIMSLLRPGGFIQWLDADPTSANAIGIDSSTSSTATEKLAELMRKPHPNAFYGWIPQVPNVFQSEKLSVIAHDTISCASFPAARTLWNQCYLLGYQEYWTMMAEKAGEQGEEARKEAVQRAATSIAELELESKAGRTLDMNYFCIVARKGD